MTENLDFITSKEKFVNSVLLYLNCVSSVLRSLDNSIAIPSVLLMTVGFRRILNSIMVGEIEVKDLNLYYVRELDKELREYSEMIVSPNTSDSSIVEKVAAITSLVLALAADINFDNSLTL